jgi:hypothetical protein
MTLTIQIPPEQEAVFQAQAQLRGLSVEQWILEIANEQTGAASIAHLQQTDPEEWARQLKEWADGHDPNLPVLSDEAINRESIYPDRA